MATAVEIPQVEDVKEQAIVPVSKAISLSLSGAPTHVLNEAKKAAKALTGVIEAKPKKVVFNGKTYLQFEDWQTLGRFYGVTAVARSTKYVEYGTGDDKVCGFEACADALLVAGNQVVSSAEAMCLNDEPNWSRKPLFQLKSMAQTRACAKALRNVLAWVVVLAGYAPTPAEEMDSVESNGNGVVMPRRKSEVPNGSTINFQQQKELFAAGEKKGMSRTQVMQVIGSNGFEQPQEIPCDKFNAILAEIAG